MASSPPCRIVVLLTRAMNVEVKEFSSAEILLGRFEDEHPANGAELWPFETDPHVSRRHARLAWDGLDWSIEDLGSRHGTFVEGVDIRGSGLVRLNKSVNVRTGGSSWILIPQDCIVAHDEEVAVFARCARAYSFAHLHSGLPLLGELTCVNCRNMAVAPRELTIEFADDGVEALRVRVPALGPHGTTTLPPPALCWRVGQLQRRVEPALAQVRLKMGGLSQRQSTRDFVLLGMWDWPCEHAASKIAAAFVLPRHALVERIVARAADSLPGAAGCARFSDLWRSHHAAPELAAMRAIYDDLACQCSIRFGGPRARTAHGVSWQTIAPPQRLLASPLGEGACLDLAFLFASCLESAGFCPLAIFVGGGDLPEHALVGCWAGSTPGPKPVLNSRAHLQREIAAQRIFVLECTGFAEGASVAKLDFEAACESGRRAVSEAVSLRAVDICALRPPRGEITPLDCLLEPEVAGAYGEAGELAREQRAAAMGTLHLIYGLLAAGGATAAWLCGDRLGSLRDAARRAAAQNVNQQAPSEAPTPSLNSFLCMRIAEENAWQNGSPSVREQDLWWAVIEQAARSPAAARFCAQEGVDLWELGERLARQTGRPERQFARSGGE